MVPDCKRLVGDGPKHPQCEPDQRRQGDSFALCSTGVSLHSIQTSWASHHRHWTELNPTRNIKMQDNHTLPCPVWPSGDREAATWRWCWSQHQEQVCWIHLFVFAWPMGQQRWLHLHLHKGFIVPKVSKSFSKKCSKKCSSKRCSKKSSKKYSKKIFALKSAQTTITDF